MSRFERLSLPLVRETGFGLNVEGSTDMLSLGLGLNSVILRSALVIAAKSSVTWNAATDTYTQNIFEEQSSLVTWNADTDTYTQELNT